MQASLPVACPNSQRKLGQRHLGRPARRRTLMRSVFLGTLKESKQPASMTSKTDEHRLISLEADDEFEDFPVDQWEAESKELADTDLWEEQWEDDDVEDDDFATKLKAELAKVQSTA